GAHLIADMIAHGRRIGITGPSHQVIAHLVDAVLAVLDKSGMHTTAIQKVSHVKQAGTHPAILAQTDNRKAFKTFTETAAKIIAGTTWLFSRPEWENALDVLIIDEAGQVPLAYALAVAPSTQAMLLLGDPQQLTQPILASHPPGADASVLAHLMHGQETIAAHDGIFLEKSWRMHPLLSRYIGAIAYHHRLSSMPGCALQRLDGTDWLSGAGLRFYPVSHNGRRVTSPEEVHAIVACIHQLLGRNWTDRQGHVHLLTLQDILVVSPYNAQVNRLKRQVPAGVRCGTVDKFQGQEAPVVLYSLTTSTLEEDTVHGPEFLLDIHRLNVAISRAQILAVLFANPQILQGPVDSVEALAMLNALCAFVAQAQTAPPN
ncbi:MAG: DEAD/DEAH box helicase, partial [Firmicutes bacterium]|nr:DEAD/DEAH box helicase [Bacillota bacterium]